MSATVFPMRRRVRLANLVGYGRTYEVLIPKNRLQSMRALGLSRLEDKLVQMMFHGQLDRVDEPPFPDRCLRIQDDAIQALQNHRARYAMAVLIDLGPCKLLDQISHEPSG